MYGLTDLSRRLENRSIPFQSIEADSVKPVVQFLVTAIEEADPFLEYVDEDDPDGEILNRGGYV